MGYAGVGSARRQASLADAAAACSGLLAPVASVPVGGSGRCGLPASSRPERRERGREGRSRGGVGKDGGREGGEKGGGDICVIILVITILVMKIRE